MSGKGMNPIRVLHLLYCVMPLSVSGLRSGSARSGHNYVSGSAWPKPVSENRVNALFSLDSRFFRFTYESQGCDVIESAVVRYLHYIFPDPVELPDQRLSIIENLNITIADQSCGEPTFDSDESYRLIVDAPSSHLESKSVWGALRGLETFSQLVYQDEGGQYYAQRNVVDDFPRFRHRGFLIDTSRHFVSVPIIEVFLDAMAFSKFNVFHWHIVDDPSFPYASPSFPDLHAYGHSLSWGSIPSLLTKCFDSSGKTVTGYGPIDPTNEDNYEFLKELFQEISTVFPDRYIHLGGDEVPFSCWQSNPRITAWMQDKGFGSNYSKLEEYYMTRLTSIVQSLGKEYVVWQEVFDNKVKLSPDAIVNVWIKGWEQELAAVISHGFRAVLSTCWYLSRISSGLDWDQYYYCEPENITATDEAKKLIIGGTACMWGEWVDATNILSRTWARGLAVGERLWSPKNVTDFSDASARIWEHRCRYIRRGIPAEDVVRSGYCRHEWGQNKP